MGIWEIPRLVPSRTTQAATPSSRSSMFAKTEDFQDKPGALEVQALAGFDCHEFRLGTSSCDQAFPPPQFQRDCAPKPMVATHLVATMGWLAVLSGLLTGRSASLRERHILQVHEGMSWRRLDLGEATHIAFYRARRNAVRSCFSGVVRWSC